MILLPQTLDSAARMPQPTAWRSSEVVENSALTSGSGKVSALLDALSVHWTPGCHSFDMVLNEHHRLSETENTSGHRASQGALAFVSLSAFLSRNDCRSHSRQAVEIAFDYENGDIVIKSDLTAELSRVAEDIDHELFRRQCRAAS